MYRFHTWLSACIFLVFYSPELAVQKIRIDGVAQGTTYHITYYAADSLVIKREIDSLLNVIDASLSLYKPHSLINQFNQSSTGLRPDKHFSTVVNKALETYKETRGAFDITVFPLTSAWGFGPVKPVSLPDSSDINKLLPCIGSDLLYWKGKILRKRKPCVQLDANGIAQGYSVDVLSLFFEKKGIVNYLIELGGEIRVKGRKLPSGEKMSVGIEAPGDDPFNAVMERIVWMDHGAITTSGNYRRYYETEGKRITHLLNPQTGYPLQNELISVTVYAKDAITADAYDNALMAMGLSRALAFTERRTDLAAHFIYRKPDGTVADTMSKRFYKLLNP